MTMSLSAARRRISVMKHSSYSEHFCPRHVSVRASSLGHSALDSGMDASSARSPVAVVLSHSTMAANWLTSSSPLSTGWFASSYSFLRHR